MTTELITDVRAVNTLDDRREIWHLLHRLSPRNRYRFLAGACSQCCLPNTMIHPSPSWLRMGQRVRAAQSGDDAQDLALTNEIYTDLFALVMQYELSAVWVAKTLEMIVRRVQRSRRGESAWHN